MDRDFSEESSRRGSGFIASGWGVGNMSPSSRAAGRIALKEAVSKALGVGVNGLGWSNGLSWREVEVVAEVRQAPTLLLHGRAKQIANERHIRAWRTSLSHDGDYAMATVIGLIA